MTTLNKIECGGASVRNTGFGKCSVHMKTPTSLVLVPRNWVATQLDEADIFGTIAAKSILDDKSARFYPLGTTFEDFEAAGGDYEEQTFASGRVVPIKEQNNAWTFTYLDGGVCLTRSIRSFDAASWSVILVSDSQIIGSTHSTGRFMGIPLETLKAPAPKPSTFSAGPVYTMTIGFKPKYVCEQIAIFELASGEAMPEFKGLNTIDVTFVVWVVSGTELRVSLLDSCFKSINYGATYAGAVTATSFVIKNRATGAVITPTTVAFETATNTYKITFSASQSNISVGLVAPSALTSVIPNAEGNPLLIA